MALPSRPAEQEEQGQADCTTTCRTASERVTLWAMVNAVMIFVSERRPPPGEQEPHEEQQVVPPAQDVVDSQGEEVARLVRAAARPADHEARPAAVGREGELLDTVRCLEAVERVVAGAEHIKGIVPHSELPHQTPAGEVDAHCEARGVEGRGHEEARARLAATSVGAENERQRLEAARGEQGFEASPPTLGNTYS